jgi:hypothetical protein
MISVNSALKVWRTFYCEGKWGECARYKLSLEGKAVPPNLLPNGKSLDLAIGQPQVAAKPAPVVAPAAVKASIPTERMPSNTDRDDAFIDLDAPVAATSAVRSAPGISPAVASSTNTISYYLRMQIRPGAGVMTEIIRSLGQSKVRIDAVTEKKGLSESEPSYLIVLTDQTDETTLNEAVAGLQNLGCVSGNIKRIALEKMVNGELV